MENKRNAHFIMTYGRGRGYAYFIRSILYQQISTVLAVMACFSVASPFAIQREMVRFEGVGLLICCDVFDLTASSFHCQKKYSFVSAFSLHPVAFRSALNFF